MYRSGVAGLFCNVTQQRFQQRCAPRVDDTRLPGSCLGMLGHPNWVRLEHPDCPDRDDSVLHSVFGVGFAALRPRGLRSARASTKHIKQYPGQVPPIPEAMWVVSANPADAIARGVHL